MICFLSSVIFIIPHSIRALGPSQTTGPDHQGREGYALQSIHTTKITKKVGLPTMLNTQDTQSCARETNSFHTPRHAALLTNNLYFNNLAEPHLRAWWHCDSIRCLLADSLIKIKLTWSFNFWLARVTCSQYQGKALASFFKNTLFFFFFFKSDRFLQSEVRNFQDHCW